MAVKEFLRRIRDLENRINADESRAFKVFLFHPEAEKPFYEPEDPEAWQATHPNGRALILQIRDCGEIPIIV